LHRNRFSRTSKTKLLRSPNCSLRINKASHLEHFAPIVIFLYLLCRIRTAWYEGLICAPMLGLTSIDLSFLGNLRSNWVVVIGLELLSLACPGLDLGSVMLHHITFVTLITVMVMLILLVWRIEFGVTGMEFVGVMPTVQGLSSAMLEACGSLSYPNLRTGSWSDHP
jgi:hypothetical protein